MAAILLCLLPLLLMAMGIDFSSAGPALLPEEVAGMSAGTLLEAAHQSLRGSYTHTIFEWTAVCIAAAVCLLALIQSRLIRDPSLPIIGVALACAGAMDAFHTFAADRLIETVAANSNLIPFTWAICRLFNGVIQAIGVGIFALGLGGRVKLSTLWTVGISLSFILSAYLIVDYCATSAKLPQTMFPGQLITRPYDIYPLVPFLICGVVIFPLYYKRNPSLFSAALLLSLIPQVATQLYMAFGSTALHDSAFNVAHTLKAAAYLFPAGGLLAENVSAFYRVRSAEAALRHNQEQMEGVLIELERQKFAIDQHAIVSIADPDGNIIYANEKFCEQSGYTLQELIGENHRLVRSEVHPPAFFQELWMTISAGKVWQGEIMNRAKDGRHYWVEATIVPFKDEAGSIKQYVAIRTDITGMKENEVQYRRVAIELQRARDIAEAANCSKSEFLANMSHEIRTPMTAILGYADLLADGDALADDPAQVADAIRTIQGNANHLLAIINDILDMSKIEAGKMTVERITTNPIQVIEEAVLLLQPRATGKGIVVTTKYDNAIPEQIQSDPTRLRQILINLLGNAIKFTEIGSVTVRVSANPPRQILQLSVVDTGMGMTPEQRKIIARFEAFSQADGSTTRKFGGSGLGLRISNSLAKMLGGGIAVESVAGQGSTFTITLATGDLTGIRMLPPGEISSLRQGENQAQAEKKELAREISLLTGYRILLAEDGLDNQRLISFHLGKAGATVTIAENGRVAFEQVLKASTGTAFDLVLMDMQMPELDGYGATRKLRQAGMTLPIIALTALAMDGDRQRCLEAGCDYYLTKPIDRSTLIRICHDCVENPGCPVAA